MTLRKVQEKLDGQFEFFFTEKGPYSINLMIKSVDKKIECFKNCTMEDDEHISGNCEDPLLTESDSSLGTVSETGETTESESE